MKSGGFTSLDAVHLHTRSHVHAHTKLEIAPLYLNGYSQSQCLINVPAFQCWPDCEKHSTFIDNTLHRETRNQFLSHAFLVYLQFMDLLWLCPRINQSIIRCDNKKCLLEVERTKEIYPFRQNKWHSINQPSTHHTTSWTFPKRPYLSPQIPTNLPQVT